MATAVRQAINLTAQPLKTPYKVLWGVILALFSLVVLAWLLNVMGFQAPALILGIIGVLAIAFFAFAPTRLVEIAGLGAAVNILQWKNPIEGTTGGVKLLYSVVLAVVYGYFASCFTLATWSFADSPGAFWVIWAGAFLVLVASMLFKIPASIAPKIIIGYSIIMMVVAVWSTFDRAYTGNAFSVATGEPTFMVDPVTGKQFNLQPANCRPSGVPHEGFNYGLGGTCFSPETGRRLVTPTVEQALQKNWRASIDRGIDAVTSWSPSLPFQGDDEIKVDLRFAGTVKPDGSVEVSPLLAVLRKGQTLTVERYGSMGCVDAHLITAAMTPNEASAVVEEVAVGDGVYQLSIADSYPAAGPVRIGINQYQTGSSGTNPQTGEEYICGSAPSQEVVHGM